MCLNVQIILVSLIKVDRISWILTPSIGPIGDKNVCVSNEEDPENWHVQVRKGTLVFLT